MESLMSVYWEIEQIHFMSKYTSILAAAVSDLAYKLDESYGATIVNLISNLHILAHRFRNCGTIIDSLGPAFMQNIAMHAFIHDLSHNMGLSPILDVILMFKRLFLKHLDNNVSKKIDSKSIYCGTNSLGNGHTCYIYNHLLIFDHERKRLMRLLDEYDNMLIRYGVPEHEVHLAAYSSEGLR